MKTCVTIEQNVRYTIKKMHESSHLSAGTLAVTVQRESAKTRRIRQKIVLAPVLSNTMHHLLLLILHSGSNYLKENLMVNCHHKPGVVPRQR